MKKQLLLSIAALALAACAPKGYQVKADLEGLEDGQTVYLSVLQGKVPRVIDTATVSGGQVTFAGEIALPMLAQLTVGDSSAQAAVQFFLENSPISVSGSLAEADSIQVTGSAEQDLYKSYLTGVDTLGNYAQYTVFGRDFVKQHPNSVAAAYVFFRRVTPGMNFSEMREFVAGFDSTLRANSIYLKLVDDMANCSTSGLRGAAPAVAKTRTWWLHTISSKIKASRCSVYRSTVPTDAMPGSKPSTTTA